MYEEYLKHFDLHVSDDIKNFVEETLKDKEYLFVRNEYEPEPISNLKVKVQYGYCSHCRKEFKTGEYLKHNEVIICSNCGAEVNVKEIRYGKKCLRNDFCFYWFDKSIIDPQIVTCKGYYLSKEYDEDYKKPRYNYNLEAVYIFDTRNNKSVMLMKNIWQSDGWEKRSSIFDFTINSLGNAECYVSLESLETAVKDTVFQYSRYNSRYRSTSIIKYLNRFCKYPWIEQLEKMNFHQLVETLVQGTTMFNSINYKGKDIFKKLRLNRAEIKELNDTKMKDGSSLKEVLTPRALRMYQLNKKYGFKPSLHEVYRFSEMTRYTYLEIEKMISYVDINKMLKYSEKQYHMSESNYNFKASVITKWIDYIENCKKLNWSIINKSILYPKDLVKAHNHTTSLINAEKNKEIDKKIKKRLPGLKKKYFFKDKDFFIRPAESSEDLINEGGTLNHCVAVHYMKPYANKETDILMIRRIDNPTQPLVTVEVKEGRVKQAYGKNDTIPKKDVQKFIEKFKTEILEKINSSKKNKRKGKAA